ncbi:MAG: DUF1585 domain-containing protein, partial [Oligoflexus sp.]
NLRVAPGCADCHSVLDPLADFFLAWGEGADLYSGRQSAVNTFFNGKRGSSVAELADIIRDDKAFATCTVQNAWGWLMGRKFYKDEETLRTSLSDYFIGTNYSFRELIYAIATHPAFLQGGRTDGVVTDPLQAPPLGEAPSSPSISCNRTYTYAADIQPRIGLCTGCHSSASTSRQSLTSESQWRTWGDTAVKMMASGQMPPGPSNSAVQALKDAVYCWMEQNP